MSPFTVAQAQHGYEAGLMAMGTAARQDFVGVGLHGAIRPGGRARFVADLALGSLDRRFAVRGEILGHFLLSPRSSSRGFYVGGGLAGVAADAVQHGYLVLLIGLESRPGRPSGWFLDAGIGGGVRVSAGYRWRKLKQP